MLGKLKNNPFWKNLWKKGRPFYVQPVTSESDDVRVYSPSHYSVSVPPSTDGVGGDPLYAHEKTVEVPEKEETVTIRVQVSKKWIFEHWDGYPPNGVSSLTTLPGASFTRELNSVGNRTYLTIKLQVLASFSRDTVREELKAHFEREGIPSNPTFTWGG